MGSVVSQPLTVYCSAGSIHVYIKTMRITEDLVDYGISVILLRNSATVSYVTYFPLPSPDYTVVSVDADDYNIMELRPIFDDDLVLTKKIYFTPTVDVWVDIDKNASRREFPIRMLVESTTDAMLFRWTIVAVNF